jgi:hypothetical protein
VAIVGADAEFGKTSTDGARDNAKAAGFTIVYDQRYPPAMTALTPIVRAIRAVNPDIVFVASYPPDTVLFVRAASEIGLAPKMLGGTMIGLLATPLKVQMGPLMNGYVNNAEVFVPVPRFNFPGVQKLLQKYRERAKGQGHRSVRIQFCALRLCGGASAGNGGGGQQKPRSHQGCGNFARQHLQNGGWRRSIRQGWRVGNAAHAGDAMAQPHRQRSRPIDRLAEMDRGLAVRIP